MAARSLEERLAALRAVDATTPQGKKALREAIKSTTGILIATAAKHVAEHNLADLVPDLVDAFERLCGDQAVKRDPGCRGKTAIARALHALDHWDDRIFVAGLRVVQREGFDGEDMAAELRGICGLAHAHFARNDALDVLAELLVDRTRTARVAAAQAIGDAGRADASALLRLKLRIGDDDPEVLAACIESLLSLSREAAHDFVIGLLAKHDDRAEAAALALGGARIASALEPLRAWCLGCSAEQRRRVGYLAIALLRSDDGNAYLLDLVSTAARGDAVAAAQALATFKETIADKLRSAARAHKDVAVRRDVDALLT
ncbi:MAG TPA: hypothetical protein VFV99_20310 [Kofleriaceae bacterium]|nr:hypothetical protein [Kofleriaceae bacterium]